MMPRAVTLLLILAVLLVVVTIFSALAGAQSLTTIRSGTITAGGTFQLVFPGNCPNGVTDAVGCPAGAPINRSGCTVTNNSSNNMFVWPNPATGATDAKAVSIPAQGSFSCNLANGKVIQDPIYIDGTTAGAFYAGQQ